MVDGAGWIKLQKARRKARFGGQRDRIRFCWKLKLISGYSLKTRWSHQLMEETMFQPVIIESVR